MRWPWGEEHNIMSGPFDGVYVCVCVCARILIVADQRYKTFVPRGIMSSSGQFTFPINRSS